MVTFTSLSPSIELSLIAVKVNVCATFQFDAVKVKVLGLTLNSVSIVYTGVTITEFVGCETNVMEILSETFVNGRSFSEITKLFVERVKSGV